MSHGLYLFIKFCLLRISSIFSSVDSNVHLHLHLHLYGVSTNENVQVLCSLIKSPLLYGYYITP